MTAQIAITIDGVPGKAPLHARITTTLGARLAPLRVKPLVTRVAFTDEDGPKRGVALRCTITLKIPRQTAVVVRHDATSPRLAFDGALAALEQRLHRRREVERTQRRRPRKYFLARRLLTGEAGERETA